jgi:hypothetical protein
MGNANLGQNTKHHVGPKIARQDISAPQFQRTRFIAALYRRRPKLAGLSCGYRHNSRGATLVLARLLTAKRWASLRLAEEGRRAPSSSRINMPSHIITLGLALALSSIPYCTEIVATKQTIVMRPVHVTISHAIVLCAGGCAMSKCQLLLIFWPVAMATAGADCSADDRR